MTTTTLPVCYTIWLAIILSVPLIFISSLTITVTNHNNCSRNISRFWQHSSAGNIDGDSEHQVSSSLGSLKRNNQITNKTDGWEKVLMTDAALKNGAVCLDGSPGGYYIRRSNNNNNNNDNWIIFHQGGGWCGSDADCYDRTKGPLGSSKDWGPTYTDTYEGSQLFANPAFDNYTIVYAMYCDGSSWTSDVDHPVKVHISNNNSNKNNNSNANNQDDKTAIIYYRGRRLLDALIDSLVLSYGLQNASTLLYSGCSAGGLTTFLHIDYISSRLSTTTSTTTTTTNVIGLADAMFSLDRNQFNGKPGGLHNQVKWGYKAWNSSYSINANCRDSYGSGAGWKCMFAEHVIKFIETPVFILNSKYDTWQRNAILGVDCDIGINCPKAKEKFYISYGQSMVKTLLHKVPKHHGFFVANCPSHCQTGTQQNWNMITINNITMKDAFLHWYKSHSSEDNGNNNGSTIRLVDAGDVEPTGNNMCPPVARTTNVYPSITTY